MSTGRPNSSTPEVLALPPPPRHDDFIVALAHELRNPLAAIDAATRVLETLHGRDQRREQHAMNIIRRQVRQMAGLVDDLLDAGRLNHGKLRCEIGPVPLANVVQDAVEIHRHRLEQRGLQLTVAMDSPWVLGDRLRLVQVFSNLLDNAVKFSEPAGRVWISTRPHGPERVDVTVRDEGRGIDPAQLRSVFELFKQSEQRAKPAGPGLGVGLALVRGLVEQQGGSVEVRSAGPGHGSEFAVTLRTCAAPAQGVADHAPSA